MDADYALLARVVEVVSGQAFERFVAREVTGPWRMVDTGFGVAAAALGRLAEPRVDPMTGAVPEQRDMRVPAVRMGGDGGMVGTAGDYLRFGQALVPMDEALVEVAARNLHLTELLADAPTKLPACLQLLARCMFAAIQTIMHLNLKTFLSQRWSHHRIASTL